MITLARRRWPAVLSLVLASLATMLNGLVAIEYGWAADSLVRAMSEDDESVGMLAGALPGLTPTLLVIDELWLLTPFVWIVVIALALVAPRTRAAYAAMALATASLITFAIVAARLSSLLS